MQFACTSTWVSEALLKDVCNGGNDLAHHS